MLSADRSFAIVFCCVWPLVAGCSSQPDTSTTPTGANVAAPRAEAAVNGPASAISPVESPPQPPADAAGAVNAVLGGLSRNQPDALWDFLPTTYQRDVTDVVHEFAEKTDAELWNRGFGTLQQAVGVLERQKQFILQSSTLKQSVVAAEQLQASWDPVVKLLSTIVDSDLADADKLKSVNLRTFLAGTGRDVLLQFRAVVAVSGVGTDPFQRWSDAKAALVSSAEQTALVRLEVPGEEPTDEPFVRVEGKWIPQRMANEWPLLLEQAKSRLVQASPHSDPQRRQRALAWLDGLDAAIQTLAAATTQEQFDAAVAPLVVMLMAVQAGLPDQAAADSSPAPEPAAADNGVKVIVLGTINDAVEDSLLAQLRNATDAPDKSDYESSRRDTLVIFDLRPVKDVEAFAKRIDFGTVRVIDKEHRAITVDLKPVQPQ